MSTKTQKEAVYEATRSVLKEHAIKFEDGQEVKPLVSTDMRKSIISIVVEGFKAGTVAIRDDFDQAKLDSYTNGMVSNWFRKDDRLNGGVKHEIANPGSRAGASNPEIKEIRKLMKTLEASDPNYAKVETILNQKVAEHKASKQKKIEIDVSNLPEELKNLVQQ